jgi:2-methylisocitrate lyase-like PEP mutase family enzyme
MTQAGRFHELLRRDGMVVAPGAYDCITAKLIAQAGFETIYMTGAGTAATFGYPDFRAGDDVRDGRERTAHRRRRRSAGDRRRRHRLWQRAQCFPYDPRIRDERRCRHSSRRPGLSKKSGHLDDKEIVPCEDWLAKIRAAAAARRNRDFVIVARTDARAVAGFDEAISRANAALAAGADMAFVEAPQTVEEAAAVPRLVRGPCLLNVVYSGKTPTIGLGEAEAMGYKLAIVPGMLLKFVVGICEEKLAELKATRRHPAPPGGMTMRQMFQQVGADEWDACRGLFRNPAPTRNAAE